MNVAAMVTEPGNGTAQTVPCKNCNQSEPNHGHPVTFKMNMSNVHKGTVRKTLLPLLAQFSTLAKPKLLQLYCYKEPETVSLQTRWGDGRFLCNSEHKLQIGGCQFSFSGLRLSGGGLLYREGVNPEQGYVRFPKLFGLRLHHSRP